MEASVFKVILDLLIIFAAAKLAGEVSHRLRQSEVVGEIIVGVLLGPHLLRTLHVLGPELAPGGAHFTEAFTLEVLAEIGVIFLLFTVGLETRVTDMMRVGGSALAVAVLGVVLPFGLGLALMLAVGEQTTGALFVATALVATSVGITARVLAELGQGASRTGRIILGAAVIDDILGLVILAIVSGMAGGKLSYLSIGLTVAEALAFTAFVLIVGRRAVHRISAHFAHFRISNPAFAISIALCLGLSALADYIGLAGIVGAFLAGMVLAETEEAGAIRRSVNEVAALLVPIFFVVMGAKVNLPGLLRPEILGLGLLVTLLAVIGKVVGCGLAAYRLGRTEALAIGVGMMPRGEVGIVVAGLGLTRGIINDDLYSVVILMVLLTTLLAPPLLRPLLQRLPRPQ